MSGADDWLARFLSGASHDAFKDVVSVETDTQPMGDGQVVIISDIKRATLNLTTNTGDRRSLKVVIKCEPPDGPGKFMAADTGAFIMETRMYNEILKLMETVMGEIGDKKYLWPVCYHCADNKFVLEDLCEEGYKIRPTYELLDVDHTLLIMAGLGKFHALSMILKERSMVDLDSFGEPFFIKSNPAMDNMRKKSVMDFSDAISTWGPEWSSTAKKLIDYMGLGLEKTVELYKQIKDEWKVLSHGDFTMRNMLFHYTSTSSKPDNIKFIDFQMCHYSSLAFDLSMILYSSLMPSVRDENMDKFLQCYADSMAETCRKHKYKGAVPTKSDVKSLLDSLMMFNISMSMFQLPFFMQSKNEDIQEKTDKFMESYSKDGDKKLEGSFIDYTNPQVIDFLKGELKKLIDLKLL